MTLTQPKFSRAWAMPSCDTFDVPAIRTFVERYCDGAEIIIDPFARNCGIGTLTNDINPDTKAKHHMDARDFLHMLFEQGIRADVVLYDPPYSARQISECYSAFGRESTMQDTQGVAVWTHVRDAIPQVLKPGGIVLSFGWSSAGVGVTRGFDIEEIMLVAHGGAHNDTICVAERLIQSQLFPAPVPREHTGGRA